MGGEENVTIFDVAADYTIHFPPTLAKSKGHGELELDMVINPIRGEQDPVTEKDNNALFYGTGGTGKTSIVRKLAYEADIYPLIEIKGSNLTPRKEDNEIGIDPLNKFIFTLCDIENVLEDDYGFSRDTANSEVRYILFVDEADNISTHNAIIEYTKLIFLKSCMEGISKDAQNPPVYRPGRLSNPLDFSWTLGDFKKEAERKPKKPTTEEIIPTITEAIDERLKELTEQLKQTKEEMSLQRNQYIGEFNQNITGDIIGVVFAVPTFGASMVLSPTARGLVGDVLGGGDDDGGEEIERLRKEREKDEKEVKKNDEEIRRLKTIIDDPNRSDEEKERAQGITNQEEQNKEAKKIWEICDKVYSLVYNVPEGVDPTEHYGFNHFKKVYERLKYLKNKSSQNQNSSNSSDYSLSNEIKGLISKNYHNFSADDLQRLAQKLLELSREYSESLNSNLKPYCDSLIETLQKLTDNAYET
ncbi:10837_t:CDS:2 [Ambispora leptoticha]|uniref:10837_t:CDS:1 n=1 Tax=Ambispora leptoticha TaxID=144679 RepID=A0A9N9BTR3_9GLOM|nr:10837_t:CDS:2 [Ambispora leptoticha]